MAIFLQNAFPKENGLFFCCFFWKRWMATLAIVFCTSFWWRKVDGGESSGTKNHFQPRKPRSSTLPETSLKQKFQKIGPNPQGKPKKYSNHPFSGALAFWIFSFRKFLWPFWYLFVRSVYHSQKESFLCFFVVFARIFFFEKKIYGASINWWESFPPNLTFEVSKIVTPRLWNNTPNWNTPKRQPFTTPGNF